MSALNALIMIKTLTVNTNATILCLHTGQRVLAGIQLTIGGLFSNKFLCITCP